MAPPSIPNEFSVFGRESMRSDERPSGLARQIARHFLRFSSFAKCAARCHPLLSNDRFQPVKSLSFRDNGRNCIR